MHKKVAIIITPNWGDYAKRYLDDFLVSLQAQDYQGEKKIFITDNETSEGSYNFLKEKIPDSVIHRNQTNDGYAKGCNDAIKIGIAQGYDYIAVFNIHTILEPGCLSEMIKVLESDENIGVVQARMMLYPEKDKISSLGNMTHFLGFGYCEGYNQTTNDYEFSVAKKQTSSRQAGAPLSRGECKNIFYPSGSSMLFRREALEKIGLLREEFWMYNEDQEIGWRIWLAGLKCVLAPDAVMYNKYEFQRSIKKFYWMDRNRILSILLCYHILTLILITPAFLVMELGLIIFSFKTGWWKEKKEVWRYFLSLKNWKFIVRARRENQALRKIKDRDIIPMISGKIWYQEVDDVKLRLINPIFNAYWWVVKKIVWR
jgi:GT2 family glycosyltransferase